MFVCLSLLYWSPALTRNITKRLNKSRLHELFAFDETAEVFQELDVLLMF